MDDLRKAREALEENELNLAIVKDGKLVFKSRSPGVGGLLEAEEELGEWGRGSSLADKVVGRAAALISVYLKMAAVFGEIMSQGAINLLERYDINHQYDEKVPFIEDEDGEPCPFEKLVEDYEDPEKAYMEIKSRVQTSRSK